MTIMSLGTHQSTSGHEGCEFAVGSREEARKIVEYANGFFSILAEWSRAKAPSSVNDTDKSATLGEHGEVRHDR